MSVSAENITSDTIAKCIVDEESLHDFILDAYSRWLAV